MELLDKILAAFKPKKAVPENLGSAPIDNVPSDVVPVDEPVLVEPVLDDPTMVEPPKVEPQQVDPAAVAEMATKLEAYVYDPEVAQELAPIFVAMSAVDGFDKVVELLDAKEKQIEAISGNTPQQSTPEVKKQTVTKPPTASEILKARNQ